MKINVKATIEQKDGIWRILVEDEVFIIGMKGPDLDSLVKKFVHHLEMNLGLGLGVFNAYVVAVYKEYRRIKGESIPSRIDEKVQ